MNLKTKWVAIAGSAIAASALLASVSFAAAPPAAPAPAPAAKAQTAKAPLSKAETDLIAQVRQLQATKMAKAKTDAQAVVAQAVKDGKITQAQADKLLQQGGKHEGKRGDKTGAPEAKDQETADDQQSGAKAAPDQETNDGNQGEHHGRQGAWKGGAQDAAQLKTNLDAKVKAGTLTQGEADVLLQLSQLRQQAEQAAKTEAKALVDQAVKDGKITQAQADQLLTHREGGFEGARLTPDQLKAKLDAAVKAGKLTQAKADQILQGFAQHQTKAPQAPKTNA